MRLPKRFLLRFLIFCPLIPGAFWVEANWGSHHRPVVAKKGLLEFGGQGAVPAGLTAAVLANDQGVPAIRSNISDLVDGDEERGGELVEQKSEWFSDRNRVMHMPQRLRPAETYLGCPVLNPGLEIVSPERTVQLQRLIDSFNVEIQLGNEQILKMQHDFIVGEVEVFDGGVPRGSEEAHELEALRDQLNEGFLAICFKSLRSDAGERVVLILPGDCPGLDSAYNNVWATVMAARRAIVRHIEGS